MPGFNIPFNDNCGQINTIDGPPHTTETARAHRYRLEILEPFGDTRTGILLYLASASRPSVEFDEIIIHNGQDEIYRPGKNRWKPLEFSFYERLFPDSNSYNQAAALIYDWWSFRMLDMQRSLHRPLSFYYKNAQLDMLDGAGRSVWSYYIYECWPQQVTPSELKYSDSAIAEINVRLRFNKAIERQ